MLDKCQRPPIAVQLDMVGTQALAPTCTHANDGFWPEARSEALRGGPCSHLAGPGLELTRTFLISLADSEALFPNGSLCFASGHF